MKDVEIKIGNRVISANEKPFVIAEMSGNHNQSFEKAIEIVHSAARSGASAIKLQTYTADTLTLDVKSPDFFVEDSNSLWKGEYLHGLYQKAFTSFGWKPTEGFILNALLNKEDELQDFSYERMRQSKI